MPTFRPEGFREVAEKLSGGALTGNEARHRTVVGRSYYSAYLAVSVAIYGRDGISEAQFQYPNHTDLPAELAKFPADPELRTIADRLSTLLARRLHADYRLALEVLEDHADDSVADAKEVEALLTPAVIKRLPKLTGKAR